MHVTITLADNPSSHVTALNVNTEGATKLARQIRINISPLQLKESAAGSRQGFNDQTVIIYLLHI